MVFAYTYCFSDFNDVIEYVFKEEWFNIDSTQLYNQIRDGMVTIQYFLNQDIHSQILIKQALSSSNFVYFCIDLRWSLSYLFVLYPFWSSV